MECLDKSLLCSKNGNSLPDTKGSVVQKQEKAAIKIMLLLHCQAIEVGTRVD